MPKGAVQGPAASYGDLEFSKPAPAGTQRIGAIQIIAFPKRNPQDSKFVTGGLRQLTPTALSSIQPIQQPESSFTTAV
ncbi:MAG: hypothetical protein IPH83_19115 [Gammaproteobacteria bacterium]|nr:hypothetical protein [Gammaproteobacteria bacterium]